MRRKDKFLKEPRRILVRATNWVGDAILSMPAIEQIRRIYPQAHLAVLARPWVAGLYDHALVDEVIPFTASADWKDWRGRLRVAAELRRREFEMAILLQNAFDAALISWLAGIPVRIGYAVKRRAWLLSHPIAMPASGEIPRHQSYAYLELLRRAGVMAVLPQHTSVRLKAGESHRQDGDRWRDQDRWIAVAPGSANGHAKRWIPERFAVCAARLAAESGARVAVFGSSEDRDVCQRVTLLIEQLGTEAINLAGAFRIDGFRDRLARCLVLICNDSGAMHVADALDVPTVAVFGPTDPEATGPRGARSVVVRQPVDCAPCLLHACPLDHRCMTSVGVERVVSEARHLITPRRSGATESSRSPLSR